MNDITNPIPKHAGGRPTSYNPDTFQAKFDEYIQYMNDYNFDKLPKDRKKPNVLRFCVFADISKETFYEYKNNREEFSDCIKKIETLLEAEIVDCMLEAPNPAGAIFYAKNKFGYSDKMEVNSKTSITTGLEDLSTEQLEDMVREIMDKKIGN